MSTLVTTLEGWEKSKALVEDWAESEAFGAAARALAHAESEVAALRSDLARHVQIAAEQTGEIDELRALLREAIEDWIEVGYRPSHEDVAAFRDICARIEKALK